MKKVTFLIDADDTLWDDGKYFVEATEAFHATMGERGCMQSDVVRIFQETNEMRRLQVGYGAYAFAAAMLDTLERLVPDHDQKTREHVQAIGERLIYHPINFLDGVIETLPELKRSSTLIMVTQGDQRYQQRKIADSGVSAYFDEIEIIPEKKASAYAALIEKHQLPPARTWMIGNSPACDINPAIEAGLQAIYIPNRYTWEIDQVPIIGQHIELVRFRDILDCAAIDTTAN